MQISIYDVFIASYTRLSYFRHAYLRSKIGIYKDQRSAQIELK